MVFSFNFITLLQILTKTKNMETYLPLNGITEKFYNLDENEINNYEIKRLRKANTKHKLEIIELKQKLQSINKLITKNKNK